MRARAIALAVAGMAGGTYVAVQGANAALRRLENLDPDAVERPGALFYLRGLGIHFIECGAEHTQAPPLVLLHGFGGSTFSFRHQFAPLARHRRVLAPDLPGFGYSDRPADIDLSHTSHAAILRELLDRLGVERAVLLGHSMGGAIALRFAAAFPDRVEKLILVDAAEPDRRFALPLFPLVRPLLPIPLAYLAWNLPLRRRWLERIVYDPSWITDEVWEGYVRPLRMRGTAASLMRLVGDVRRDPPLAPSLVMARTLILWGEADTAIPLRVAHRFHAVMPNARLEVIPRAGHLPLEEQPEACNEAIVRFLGATTSGQAVVT